MTGPDKADPRLEELARELLARVTPCRHSVDFASVSWNGAYYTFTAAQARVVALLWREWENGTPEVRQETLLEASGSAAKRLARVFQGHDAFGAMIVQGSQRGLFRLDGTKGGTK